MFSYQEELFACLKLIFSETSNSKDVIDTSSNLPLLLRGYVEQSREAMKLNVSFEKANSNKKRKISGSDSGEILFWKWLCYYPLNFLKTNKSKSK